MIDVAAERAYIPTVEVVVYAEASQFVLAGAGAEPSDAEDDELSNAELAVWAVQRRVDDVLVAVGGRL